MHFQSINNLLFPFDIDKMEEKTVWERNQDTDSNKQLLYAARPAMYMSRIFKQLKRHRKFNHYIELLA